VNRSPLRLILLLSCLVVAGGLVALVVVRRAEGARQIAARGIPPRPDLTAWPTELEARIRGSEDAVLGRGDPLHALASLASLCHANGFYAEAQHAYSTLRQLAPADARWHHRSGHIHAVFGELEQAIPLFEKAVELDTKYVPSQVQLGEVLLKSGRLVPAVNVFTGVLKREADNPYAQLGLARVDIARDEWPAARQKLERVARQTEGLLGADLLATAYEHTGEPERGVALRARQKSHGMYVGIADPWIDELMDDCYDPYRLALESGTAGIRKDKTRAQRLLDRALRLDPNDANLHFQAGALAEQHGDLTGARNRLEAAVRLDPKLTDAWARLVRVLNTAGDQQGSWRVLTEALAKNPESPILLLERGRRFKAQGRTDAAMADLRRVTRLRRDEALAFIELASLYFAQERNDEGIRILEQGLEAEPGNPAALAIITFASIHRGWRERAEFWLREVHYQPRVSPPEVQRLHRAFQEKFGVAPPVIR
jgi:tetratricopeptide (TPR) repeat protein